MECKSIREIKDVNTLWELIDTLWNVNLEQLIRAKQNLRINRYIMECKWMKKEKHWKEQRELIDTLWNVNTKIIIPNKWHFYELIDTLWNVNAVTEAMPDISVMN